MPHRTLLLLASFVVGASLVPASASAQLGTFRWQMQPFCNVVTLSVTQSGSVFRVEGSDDQCGSASGAASAIGTAFLNPDGSIGMGLNIVAAPSGAPLHVDATLDLTSVSGTWRDSAGNSGTFILTPGAAVPGSPRPAGGLGAVAVTTVTAGPGLTGGGVAGVVNLAVAFAGSGAAASAAHSDHTHAFGTASSENTAIGASALAAGASVLGNTAVGYQSLAGNVGGNYNTAIGANVLEVNSSGLSNVGVGYNALKSNQSGNANTAIGSGALAEMTTGSGNAVLGQSALRELTSGADNIAIGRQAFENLLSGSGNIAIGALAGYAMSGGTNNIHIGNQGFAADNNTIRIGNNSHVGTIITGIANQTSAGGVQVFVNGGGRMGTATSSIRFKTDITPAGNESRKLLDLRPVRFIYRPEYDDGSQTVQFGLIAEEVAETFPELVARDERGAPWTVRYHLLVPLLIAEVQRLERERMGKDDEMQRLRERLERIERVLDQR